MNNQFGYEKDLKQAIHQFWRIRDKQTIQQKQRNIRDQGTRGAVTGGQQLNGFLDMLMKISIDAGVPKDCIFIEKSETFIPGFFRSSKSWDFLIVSQKEKKLIACLEFKSQVGSFGNNLNNRTEEALGNALDLITACKRDTFRFSQPPWLGFILVVQKCKASDKPVSVKESHFKARAEFLNKSYLERYNLLCRKLMQERLYNGSSLIWTENNKGKISYGEIEQETSFRTFVEIYYHYLLGRNGEF